MVELIKQTEPAVTNDKMLEALLEAQRTPDRLHLAHPNGKLSVILVGDPLGRPGVDGLPKNIYFD
jgi:hypothetical protein